VAGDKPEAAGGDGRFVGCAGPGHKRSGVIVRAVVVVPLVLNLTGPLAVSHRTVGNVVETLDFLPGSYLLPHVTRTLTNLGVDPRGAIQRGDLLVLSATLEVDEARGRPVPMALFHEKG